jgi:hypothetical protein
MIPSGTGLGDGTTIGAGNAVTRDLPTDAARAVQRAPRCRNTVERPQLVNMT